MFCRANVEPPPDVAVPPRALDVLRWPLVSIRWARARYMYMYMHMYNM